ncbi:hypothetical protein GCM10023221_10580 [Luteimicrobium xylanilyticum]|uniref:Uncharacterized protein n=1 Tax=Luteimicrobium xylanilyticum TaxID=1133546 RepID=A0A5P9QDY9_9MICO|nr:hypothetical protein [Luteimicrobium xylanilyticum]QFU99466.1 hypothetical protein KDY119_02997 [Luteimicrobium xylanilyticum]
MAGTASTPEPTPAHPVGPGNMRPVHDGAGPADEARRRAEGRIRGWLSWAFWTAGLAVLVLVILPRLGWIWAAILFALWIAVDKTLDRLLWPRAGRSAAAWLLARKNRRNAR